MEQQNGQILQGQPEAARNGDAVRAAPPLHVEATNGHAPHHISQDEEWDADNDGDDAYDTYPSPSTSDNGERAKVSQEERSRLRFSTPFKLVQEADRRLETHLFWWLLAIRLINAAVASRTVYAPDEHWQSLEIAHRLVFGYGWLTWEWIDRRPSGSWLWGAYWGDGPIRSIAYPLLITPIYALLKLLRLDNHSLLTIAPYLLHALPAAMTDWFTFRLTRRILNERAAWTSLLVCLASMNSFYTATRPLSNSIEAALTAAALFYWPLSLPESAQADVVTDVPLVDSRALFKSIMLFAASTALRPSNVLLSIPLVVVLVRNIALSVKSAASALEATFALIILGRIVLATGFASSLLLLAVDSFYYGRMTFTPLAFLKRNVLQGISLFYGASPLHFYLTSALPFVASTMMPFALRGMYFACKRHSIGGYDKATFRWFGSRGERDPAALESLGLTAVAFVILMSLLGHKEVRFLQPLVPVLHLMTAYALVLLPPFHLQGQWMRMVGFIQVGQQRRPTVVAADSDIRALMRQARIDRAKQAELLHALTNFTSWQGRRHLLTPSSIWRPRVVLERLRETIRFIRVWQGPKVVLLIAAQLLPMLYLAVHSRGQVLVAEEVGRQSRAGLLDSVAYLMPCHSTPWMSHMHSQDLASSENKAWFITCEPPLEAHQTLHDYRDESDDFYEDPYGFLKNRVGDDASLPSSATWLSGKTRQLTSHLVLFEALLREPRRNKDAQSLQVGMERDTVGDLLRRLGYTVQKSYWNSVFHPDRRRRGRVLLMRRAQGS